MGSRSKASHQCHAFCWHHYRAEPLDLKPPKMLILSRRCGKARKYRRIRRK